MQEALIGWKTLGAGALIRRHPSWRKELSSQDTLLGARSSHHKTPFLAQGAALVRRHPSWRKELLWSFLAQGAALVRRHPSWRKELLWSEDTLLGARSCSGQKTPFLGQMQRAALVRRHPSWRRCREQLWSEDTLLGAESSQLWSEDTIHSHRMFEWLV